MAYLLSDCLSCASSGGLAPGLLRRSGISLSTSVTTRMGLMATSGSTRILSWSLIFSICDRGVKEKEEGERCVWMSINRQRT